MHFERSHSGIPDINPETHRLLIHGLVKRPLVFTLESLSRYPREQRVTFCRKARSPWEQAAVIQLGDDADDCLRRASWLLQDGNMAVAVRLAAVSDVPLLYWTAAAWAFLCR